MSIQRTASQAWEAMFRATVTIGRELAAGEAGAELKGPEYGVLYALSQKPEGMRITDLGEDVLLTQTGLTRLAARLVRKGLVQRAPDPEDGRATLLLLTDRGRAAQRKIGTIHAREITAAMTARLTEEELLALRALCAKLSGAPPVA
ncbi:MAG TPA: MarR family transcriptional regulator [Pseudolysinimonas sp.]|nr:MarR family transcriptional regulator [Pseudolysinimonas sp.]